MRFAWRVWAGLLVMFAAGGCMREIPADDVNKLRAENAELKKKLAALGQLQLLDLGHASAVTDADLKEFAALTQLQRLRFGGNRVTDAGIKALADHKQLQLLEINFDGAKSEVTAAGVEELREALP